MLLTFNSGFSSTLNIIELKKKRNAITYPPYGQWLSSLGGAGYRRPVVLSHQGGTLTQKQSVIIPQIVPLHYWILSQRRLSAAQTVGWVACIVIESSSPSTIKAVIAYCKLARFSLFCCCCSSTLYRFLRYCWNLS